MITSPTDMIEKMKRLNTLNILKEANSQSIALTQYCYTACELFDMKNLIDQHDLPCIIRYFND